MKKQTRKIDWKWIILIIILVLLIGYFLLRLGVRYSEGMERASKIGEYCRLYPEKC